MPKLHLVKGTTSKRAHIFVPDSSSSVGAGLTGLAFNTASLSGYYYREGAGAATAITLATSTLGTYTSGAFKEISAANMPGAYEVGIPDAALATGADSVIVMYRGAANMAPVVLEIQLTDVNLHDAVRQGMTALPNAAAEAAGGLFTRGTGAGQINQAANGMVDTNPVRLNNVSQSLLDLKDFADDGYDPSTNKVTGVLLADTVTTYTGNTPQTGDAFARLPAALVAGRIDASVGAMAAGTVTATAIATAAIDADAISGDAVIEIQAGLATAAAITALNNLSAAQVKAEVVTALTVDTIPELSQATPAATPTFRTALMLLYMALRNQHTQSTTERKITNDAGTVIAKSTTSDSGTVFTQSELAAGP